MARGNFGNTAQHQKAGSMSSGNKNAATNLNNAARSKGGSMSPGNFKNRDKEEIREIASKGGSMSGGNFKNDPQRAREAGKKGGQS